MQKQYFTNEKNSIYQSSYYRKALKSTNPVIDEARVHQI